MGQMPWLSLLPCLGKYPVALSQPVPAAQVVQNTVLVCSVTRQKRKTSRNHAICVFFSFPFAQLIFPVLIVSEHCRGFIKHWSLGARDRRRSFLSSLVHSAGVGKVIGTVAMRRPKFCKGRHQVPLVSNCPHLFLYSEYISTYRCPTGLVMYISSCNNHMFDLNMRIYACVCT